MTPELFHIEASVPTGCFESTAFRLNEVRQLGEHLPVEPGAVRVDAEGRNHLHFSPGRWLSVCPPGSSLRGLPEKVVIVDVSGKWHRLRLTGSDAEKVLRFQLGVEGIFAGRACAAVSLFECPAVIERLDRGFDTWTHASYSEHLREALAGAHRNLQRTARTEAS